MTEQLIPLMNSLADIMDEETDLLARGDWPPDNDALASAKMRLTGALEAMLAEQERTAPEWLSTIAIDGPLAGAIGRVRDSAVMNANMLSRQIDLSQELLAEIAREAGRIGGTRQQIYRRGGQLDRRDDPPPVTLNTRL